MRDELKKDWFAPSFLLSLILALLAAGVSYGAMSYSVSSLKSEVEKHQSDYKDLEKIYVRLDVYEAKHKALEDKIDSMSKNVEDIKFFLMGKK